MNNDTPKFDGVPTGDERTIVNSSSAARAWLNAVVAAVPVAVITEPKFPPFRRTCTPTLVPDPRRVRTPINEAAWVPSIGTNIDGKVVNADTSPTRPHVWPSRNGRVIPTGP